MILQLHHCRRLIPLKARVDLFEFGLKCFNSPPARIIVCRCTALVKAYNTAKLDARGALLAGLEGAPLRSSLHSYAKQRPQSKESINKLLLQEFQSTVLNSDIKRSLHPQWRHMTDRQYLKPFALIKELNFNYSSRALWMVTWLVNDWCELPQSCFRQQATE